PKLNRVDGTERGINIGPEESRFIQMGMKLFYENAAAPNPPSLRRAYRDTLGKYFNSGLIIKGGVSTPTFGSTHELPSLGQVLYWYKKLRNPTESLIAREGIRRFNLRHRALGGDAAAAASGPGAIFQIDSTPGNINLVSALDPARLIGRPVVYFIVDVF